MIKALHPILWNENVFNMMVEPTIEYGSEASVMNGNMVKKVFATEIMSWRMS